MMHKSDLLDLIMFYALLVLVIFIPYSAAMIQAALFILMLSWSMKRFFNWQHHPKENIINNINFSSQGLFWPLMAITLLILFTIPFSNAPDLSLKKFFSRFLQQIFLMYATIEIINSIKRLYIVIFFLLWTLIVVMIDAVFQYFVGHSFIFHKHTIIYDRISGSMRHPNDLGTLLVATIPMVTALILTRKFWLKRFFEKKWYLTVNIILIVLCFFMLLSLGLTSSRGAWVAFIISMIAASVYLKRPLWTAIVAGSLIVFLSIFGFYLTQTRSDIFGSANDSSVKSSSIEDTSKKLATPSRRFEYWQTALKVIEQFPLFGCGYNAYIQTLQKYKYEPVEYPHNSVLHIAAELGIVGLVLYIWFWTTLFIEGIKALKTIESQPPLHFLGVGILFGICAWFIHSLFDTPWESLQLSILWWFLIGVLFSVFCINQRRLLEKK